MSQLRRNFDCHIISILCDKSIHVHAAPPASYFVQRCIVTALWEYLRDLTLIKLYFDLGPSTNQRMTGIKIKCPVILACLNFIKDVNNYKNSYFFVIFRPKIRNVCDRGKNRIDQGRQPAVRIMDLMPGGTLIFGFLC